MRTTLKEVKFGFKTVIKCSRKLWLQWGYRPKARHPKVGALGTCVDVLRTWHGHPLVNEHHGQCLVSFKFPSMSCMGSFQ